MGWHLKEARRGRGRRGQALTEFALVVPLLLLMVLGVMEFGRAWGQSQVVTDAARQGARMAAVLNGVGGVTQDSVIRVVQEALRAGSVNPDADGVDINVDGFQDGTNTPVKVTVSVPFDFGVFKPVFQLAAQSYSPKDERPFDGTITLRSSAIMRNE